MIVPFGTRVVDSAGKPVGTVRHVVLHPETRQIDGLVVHQGVMRSRDLVVPLGKVAGVDQAVRLTVRAADLDALPLFRGEHLRPMPDHWDMPEGFDERDLFLVGGSAWSEATLPFTQTSPAASGTPAYVSDKDSIRDPEEPDIAKGMPVYDSAGKRIGDVESVGIDDTSAKITWIVVRRGHLFAHDTAIPASMIASVGDRITLNAQEQALRRLERAA
jgi:sporulation protein YlmC with PRC-barrel domain